ncbi:MAG: DMT family transporter [Gammaproteobacteria bacterium]|nr:DMT family transporter [Gammaproteobacteria bacterium]
MALRWRLRSGPGPTAKATLQIHFCVLLWGFTAILGRLISLPALALVWWRMLLVVGALLLLPRVRREMRRLPWRLTASYAGVGALVALHWLTFYAAIKLADASVAATCIALAPIFLALIEPHIAGRRFDPRELVLGALVVPGVALVVGGIPRTMWFGAAVGVTSALLDAVFGALNKRLVGAADALTITALELGAGWLLLSLPLALSGGWRLPDTHDAWLLVTLAYACTLLPFSLSLVALRQLSAFSVQMAVNLEPVYAVLLAVPIFGEQRQLSIGFYGGLALILGALFAQPLLKRPRGLADAATLAVEEGKSLGD